MAAQDSRYLRSQGTDGALPIPSAPHPEKGSCYLWIRPKRSPGVDKGAEVRVITATSSSCYLALAGRSSR